MNYTKSSRQDGCWDIEQECHDEDTMDYGPVEIFKLRRADGPGKGTRRPICQIENADMDGLKSECGGNIALIASAPILYESLRRAAETLRFLVNTKKNGGVGGEVFNCMADAEGTLRLVQITYEALMWGEHVS